MILPVDGQNGRRPAKESAPDYDFIDKTFTVYDDGRKTICKGKNCLSCGICYSKKDSEKNHGNIAQVKNGGIEHENENERYDERGGGSICHHAGGNVDR